MDGYYAEGETDKDNPESNALSAVVRGVDLMLDASSHESIPALIFADLFKKSQLIDTEIEKLPGYVMVGVDSDYFNQIVINSNNMTDDYNYYLHRTANFPEDPVTKKKYSVLVEKYLKESGLEQNEIILGKSFSLKGYRNIQEHVFKKLL